VGSKAAETEGSRRFWGTGRGAFWGGGADVLGMTQPPGDAEGRSVVQAAAHFLGTFLISLLLMAALLPLVAPRHGAPAAVGAKAGVDSRFVALGRSYLPELGRAYAAAWEEGACALEAGEPIDAALERVAVRWERERTALFDRMVTPRLETIVPEGVDESAISPAARIALGRAWRGFGFGLATAARR